MTPCLPTRNLQTLSLFLLLLLLLPANLPALDTRSDENLPQSDETLSELALLPLLQEVPDTLLGWGTSWSASLNGSQSSYSNWSKGGSNNLSVAATSEFVTLYRNSAFSYGLRILTNYGQSRVQGEGVRKTDDRLSIRNRFLYRPWGGDQLRLFGNLNLESQFTPGYEYEAGPEGEDIRISDFFAPAYFTQNAGLAWLPSGNLSFEAGLGLKQTLVSDTSLSTRYGLDPGRKIRGEAGYTTGITYEAGIWENVVYTGYLETFTNFSRPLKRTDVVFSNRLTGRINNNLNLTFQFEMIYDDDFSRKLQLSQVLSAGLVFVIF